MSLQNINFKKIPLVSCCGYITPDSSLRVLFCKLAITSPWRISARWPWSVITNASRNASNAFGPRFGSKRINSEARASTVSGCTWKWENECFATRVSLYRWWLTRPHQVEHATIVVSIQLHADSSPFISIVLISHFIHFLSDIASL